MKQIDGINNQLLLTKEEKRTDAWAQDWADATDRWGMEI